MHVSIEVNAFECTSAGAHELSYLLGVVALLFLNKCRCFWFIHQFRAGPRGAKRAPRRARIENVVPAARVNSRLVTHNLEMIRTFLQILPKRKIWIGTVFGQILSCHAKR